MPAPVPPPESIIFDKFSGMKNTVTRERLSQDELERAINVDIDNAGQPRRRRGYVKKISGECHSLWGDDRVYVVKAGMLSRVNDDYTTVPLVQVGSARVAFTEVNGDVYFSSNDASGIIAINDTVRPWGYTNGQGAWISPVIHPTATLGVVGGRLLGDPPRATCLASYSGRIYLAVGKTLWATELYQYNVVDRTENYMQFEEEITVVMAVADGLFIGTKGGLHFIQGTLGKFKLNEIDDKAVLFGSGQYLPAQLIHPNAGGGNVPTDVAAVVMSNAGVIACFSGGTAFNLTQDKMLFPEGVSAASLFRQDQGANAFVVAVDSAGGPSAGCRIGDYVDAQIVRGGGI
jgi:hypothetical protein